MEGTEFNLPLLRKAVEWVEHEDAKPPGEFCEWAQLTWRTQRACGTAYCVAGYVCQISGGQWIPGSHVLEFEEGEDGRLFTNGSRRRGISAMSRATRLLGLRDTEAATLFEASNSAEEIRGYAERFANRRGKKL